MAFFGLKLGLDLKMQAAHPHQKFRGVPPPGDKHRLVQLRIPVCILVGNEVRD